MGDDTLPPGRYDAVVDRALQQRFARLKDRVVVDDRPFSMKAGSPGEP